MSLRRGRVNVDVENEILTALITNTKFVRKVRKIYNSDYFSDYGKIISGWVIEYWDTYREAPGKNITSIYRVEKGNLQIAVAESISVYLEGLSEAFAGEDTNIPYLVEKTHAYFRKKSYELLFSRGRDLILAGRMDDAVKLHDEFRGSVAQASRWENPLDRKTVLGHFDDLEDNIYELFKFRGALGELIGPFERGWLVAVLGPMKRGKSFWLQEILFRAAASRKRVAYINLEMIGKGVRDREYTRLVGVGRNTPQRVRFPVFDCQHNQRGTCPVVRMRQNDIVLYESDSDDVRIQWDTPGYGDYRICSACRDDLALRTHYIPAVWYVWHTPKRTYSEQGVQRSAAGFVRQYGDRIRQITYPAFSVTIEDIRRDLDELEWAEGFRPDGVLLDYADIVATRDRAENERAHVNAVWKQMKGSAVDMGSLWVTGSQTNRNAVDKVFVEQKDIGEDIRKLAHVDVMLSINQTDGDKEDLITRMTCMAHRHRLTDQRKQIAVLHQLEIGMPYLDSEIWKY